MTTNRIVLDSCELSNITYGGAEEKIGIVFNDTNYILKFKKNSIYGPCYNDISEYIGSKIFEYVGMKAQYTFLATYIGRDVVACKDFNEKGKFFKPFNDVGESSINDIDNTKYTYEDIISIINKSNKVKDKDKCISFFWDMYIVDSLIANSDRHGKNWGFIYVNGEYLPAPIFDNGSSLFSSLVDEDEIRMILSDEEEINERVFEIPKSIIMSNNRKSDYYTIISSKKYKYCNEALIRIFPKINLKKIYKLIDSVDMPNCRKDLLKLIINRRYTYILEKTYKEITNETE